MKSNIGKTSFLRRLWILWLHIRRNKNVKWGMTFQASCKWIPWEKQKQSFIVFSKTLPLNFRLKNHNSLPGYYSLQQFIIQYFFIVLHYLVILNSNHISKGDLKLISRLSLQYSNTNHGFSQQNRLQFGRLERHHSPFYSAPNEM